jgi:alkylhydroperoxidase family enzyme
LPSNSIIYYDIELMDGDGTGMSDRIPRLSLEELDPRLAAALAPRVARLGYLGEFFRCAGHQPEALLAFHELTEALKHALPDRLTEIVALTVAVRTGNDYERHQHERLSEKLGFGRDWVAAVELLDPIGLAGAEQAVQRLTLRSLDGLGKGVAAELAAVIDAIGPERAIAVLMLIGRYATHALIVNALALAPPVPSIFAGDSA